MSYLDLLDSEFKNTPDVPTAKAAISPFDSKGSSDSKRVSEITGSRLPLLTPLAVDTIGTFPNKNAVTTGTALTAKSIRADYWTCEERNWLWINDRPQFEAIELEKYQRACRNRAEKLAPPADTKNVDGTVLVPF